MRVIPQRDLRNDIGRILREVEAGERLRITADGRPVAGTRRTFVPREDVIRLLKPETLDRAFKHDLDAVNGDTIDELP